MLLRVLECQRNVDLCGGEEKIPLLRPRALAVVFKMMFLLFSHPYSTHDVSSLGGHTNGLTILWSYEYNVKTTFHCPSCSQTINNLIDQAVCTSPQRT